MGIEDAITHYIEETLNLSGDDSTTIIDIKNSTFVGVELEGPDDTPTHEGMISFEESFTDNPKTMATPVVQVTPGNVIDEFVPLPFFCAQKIRIKYVRTSGGAEEDLIVRVRAKRTW